MEIDLGQEDSMVTGIALQGAHGFPLSYGEMIQIKYNQYGKWYLFEPKNRSDLERERKVHT